ncbi:MAG: Asp-tRNA(Asn)/Glu-tRNA(Gln) amidotransferase subunit GatA [Alphaproteobacteria bacterium]|nr:Asp-tRNA(Asn)/Glu-tRNA(Gln) amidotransferase subunit GatA [Alphaproteobacteria bacterium]MBL0717957.1 Asp-tRNA(Asn)/Glu-tRNA(Gln) amidotransferase subunit GatA [Alphaproteobacteria bacterium]
MKISKLTVYSALKLLKSGEMTATEILNLSLEAVEEKKELNAFITTTIERAGKDAICSDTMYKDKKPRLLEGIPIAHKDMFCTKNIKTTAGSKMLENFVPQYESTVSNKLKELGTVLIGKTNQDEFGMGSNSLHSFFGSIKNPYSCKETLSPGGSSGGSAVSVASGQVLLATGTDTGGSIRQPASYNGIVGYKPTYGLVSRWGCIAYASSLDCPGIFGKTVLDTAYGLTSIAGHDEKDGTSSTEEAEDYLTTLIKMEEEQGSIDLKGYKIGIIKEIESMTLSDEVREKLSTTKLKLEKSGAEFIELSIPSLKFALPAYYTIALAESSANLARYDGIRYGHSDTSGKTFIDRMKLSRTQGFGEEVQRRIILGTTVLASGFYDAYFIKASKVRRVLYNEFQVAFKKCDSILMPTTPNTAPVIDDTISPLKEYSLDLFTVPINLIGSPAISIPAGLSDRGLPIGLQLVSKQFEDAKLLKLAYKIEHIIKGQKNDGV